MQIKILCLDDFDIARKAREGDGRRVQFGHLCIYKILGEKSATYFRRYIDHLVAHLPESEIEKWLLRNQHDEGNFLFDQVDTA